MSPPHLQIRGATLPFDDGGKNIYLKIVVPAISRVRAPVLRASYVVGKKILKNPSLADSKIKWHIVNF